MRKNEWILIMIIIGVASIVFLVSTFFIERKQGNQVEIKVENEVVGIFSLNENREIEIPLQGGLVNIARIENGAIEMVKANCPDKVCIGFGKIKNVGETIICLPHKVVIQIK